MRSHSAHVYIRVYGFSEQQRVYESTIKSALKGAQRDCGNCTTFLEILKWRGREDKVPF